MKKIYLAGGWTPWRSVVKRIISDCEWLDPQLIHDNPDWFDREVELLKESDGALVYITEDNPSGFGSTFEMGLEYGLNKPYILVNEKKDKYQWGMQTRGAMCSFTTLHDAFEWIKRNHWMNLTVADYDYYPNGAPCKHPGCLSHKSHACEVCGRIEGQGEAFIVKSPLLLKSLLYKDDICRCSSPEVSLDEVSLYCKKCGKYCFF